MPQPLIFYSPLPALFARIHKFDIDKLTNLFYHGTNLQYQPVKQGRQYVPLISLFLVYDVYGHKVYAMVQSSVMQPQTVA